MYLFIPQVFTKNNATIITQSDADGVYKHNVNITYGYRANGYPKTADANIEDVGSIDTSYQYKCIYVYTY